MSIRLAPGWPVAAEANLRARRLTEDACLAAVLQSLPEDPSVEGWLHPEPAGCPAMFLVLSSVSLMALEPMQFSSMILSLQM
jgi:hypothetical protein